MAIFKLETTINAPIERCFLLSLSIDLHKEGLEHTKEKPISGTTSGIIRKGESVTWEAKHFGLTLRHTSKITEYEEPKYFQDLMTKGVFKSFVHDHYFYFDGSQTRMSDTLRFESPLGPLGSFVDFIFLSRYLRNLIELRNQTIKKIAESNSWQKYLD
jgi:ligand-binding SRPBCC domain-containing protein